MNTCCKCKYKQADQQQFFLCFHILEYNLNYCKVFVDMFILFTQCFDKRRRKFFFFLRYVSFFQVGSNKIRIFIKGYLL